MRALYSAADNIKGKLVHPLPPPAGDTIQRVRNDITFEEVNKDQIILGIDPGTIVLGYGIIKTDKQKIHLLSMGVIHLSKYEDALEKLKIIYEKVQGLIENYHPDCCAIETPFYGKNVQSMLKLGRAQGVAIASALTNKVPVFEYSPKKIKQSVTGNGNSSKEQVAAMLQRLCQFELQPKFLDATDGLAAAICHHFQNKTQLTSGKKLSGWADFVKQNPEKIKPLNPLKGTLKKTK